MDICEVQVVSCDLRPQILASWHLAVMPSCGGSLATLQLGGEGNLNSSSLGPVPDKGTWTEKRGRGAPIIFACFDHFCLGLLTQTASRPTCTDLERNQFFGLFLGSFIDCQGKRKPEN